MVQINFAKKQVSAKVVYYGPGMSGKTTNLEVVHQRAPGENKGELTSISTDGDRTLFFDYMPLDLGQVAGMRTSFQIYTVPGQVYYNSTRKLVLQGVDGVIFIADSSADQMEANLESLRNLEENLNEYGKSLATMPHVIQYNKRDIPGALSVEELTAQLNLHGAASFEAIASTGQGVFPTLKALASAVLKHIMQESLGDSGPKAVQAAGVAPLASAPAPAPAGPLQMAEEASPDMASSSGVAGAQEGYAAPPQQQQPMMQQPAGQQPMMQQPAGQQPMMQQQAGQQPMMQQQAGQQPMMQQPMGGQQAPVGYAPQAQQQQQQYAAAPAVAAAPQQAPAGQGWRQQQPAPGQLMGGAPQQAAAPARRGTRRRAPEPEPVKRGGNGAVKTGAFVAVAAAVGAVVAKYALSVL